MTELQTVFPKFDLGHHITPKCRLLPVIVFATITRAGGAEEQARCVFPVGESDDINRMHLDGNGVPQHWETWQ